MARRHVPLDVVCCGAALEAVVPAGRWADATALWRAACDHGLFSAVVSTKVSAAAAAAGTKAGDVTGKGGEVWASGTDTWCVVTLAQTAVQIKLDLHGLPAAVAVTALRTVLHDLRRQWRLRGSSDGGVGRGCSIVVVTGRGVHSPGPAVLPGEVRSFLAGCGIDVSEVPHNEGRLLLTDASLERWLRGVSDGDKGPAPHEKCFRIEEEGSKESAHDAATDLYV
jgi:hypothetical protein